mgnify:CR=1 FL=1
MIWPNHKGRSVFTIPRFVHCAEPSTVMLLSASLNDTDRIALTVIYAMAFTAHRFVIPHISAIKTAGFFIHHVGLTMPPGPLFAPSGTVRAATRVVLCPAAHTSNALMGGSVGKVRVFIQVRSNPFGQRQLHQAPGQKVLVVGATQAARVWPNRTSRNYTFVNPVGQDGTLSSAVQQRLAIAAPTMNPASLALILASVFWYTCWAASRGVCP